MNKRIVLDVDGVILDFGNNYINFAEKLLNRKLNPNSSKYPLHELLQIDKSEADFVWSKFSETKQWEKIPPFSNVQLAINKLNKLEIDIYIVTAIDNEHKESRLKNLKKIGLIPKGIFCVGSGNQSKHHVIKDINPIAFIDDRLDHLAKSNEVEHLVWIDQKQEQTESFNNYHVKVDSLYEWTNTYLESIINNKKKKMRL
jgi:soluble P-type ATPase